LTVEAASQTTEKMGRKQINGEQMLARFVKGTIARIDAVLRPKESRAGFIRTLVEAEIARREAENRDTKE